MAKRFRKSYYETLANSPLEDWIAAFLLRNKYFQEDCEKFASMPPHGTYPDNTHAIREKYGVFVINWEPEKRAAGRKLKVHFPSPVRCFRIVEPDGNNVVSKLGELREKAICEGRLSDTMQYEVRDQNLKSMGIYSYPPFDFLLNTKADEQGRYDVNDVLQFLRKQRW